MYNKGDKAEVNRMTTYFTKGTIVTVMKEEDQADGGSIQISDGKQRRWVCKTFLTLLQSETKNPP